MSLTQMQSPDRRYLIGALLIISSVIPSAAQTGTGTGLKGSYYSNTGLRGTVALVRTDATVDFRWGQTSPVPSIAVNEFSVRWTGKVEAPVTGAYTFYTQSDDGVRLWVNGKLLINHWNDHSSAFDQAVPINLTAGQKYDVQLDYYEDKGNSVIQLRWSYPTQNDQIIPKIRLYPGDVTLQPAPPAVSRVWLSDVPWISAVNGWGPPQQDRSNGERDDDDGKPITIGGRRYSYGLGVHARSELKFALDDRYDMFRSIIGVDDETGVNGSVVFEVWLDGRRAYQSPVMRGNMPGLAIEVPVENVREMTLIVTDAGDGIGSDHADWAEARFEGVERVKYLSDMNWVSATNGSGPVEKDRANGGATSGDGSRIQLLDFRYRKGLGTQAVSEIKYKLNRQYELFSSIIGVDDSAKGPGSVTFEVWKGTARVFNSPLMRRGDPVRHVMVPVSDADEITLKVLNGGDGNTNDLGDWADAKLLPLGSDYAAPTAPTGLSAKAGSGFVDLEWNKSPNAITYSIYRGLTAGGEAAWPIATNITTNTYKNMGLTNGTKYFYKVKAVNPAGTSGYSNEASATPIAAPPSPPAAPSGLTATGGNAFVRLNWTAVTGATSYNVYRGTTAGGQATTPIATNVTQPTYNNTNLTNGTAYFYKVAAVNAGGISARSNEASATPQAPLPSPTNLTAAGGDKLVSLNWTGVTGAASYNVYRGTTAGGESPTPIAMNVTATTYVNSGLTNGTRYFYKVAAVNGPNVSPQSNEASATPAVTLTAPTGLTATGGDALVTLKWNAVTGAATYNVYRGTVAGGESPTPVATNVTGTTYVNNGLTNGTKYFYKVAAVNGASVSPQSNEANATPALPLTAPTGLTATGADTLITLKWNAVTGAATYNVYRGTTAGGESPTPVATNVTGTTYVNNGLTNGTRYFYKVAAVNGASVSPQSNEASATPAVPLTAPTGLTATGGDTLVTLNWTAVTGATSYNVYRGTTAGGQADTPVATNVTAPTFVNNGLTNGTKYYYKVAAVNGTTVGPRSTEASATPAVTLTAPSGVSAAPGNARITLTWTAVTGATSYNVYRGTTAGGQSTAPVATNLTAPTYLNTNLTNGTKYFYKVAGVNAGGVGAQSAEVSATPMAVPAVPSGLTVTEGNATVTLSWTAVPGADTYNVYRGTTANGQGTTPFATSLTAPTFVNSGLTNGTTYFYRVTALNVGGESARSSEISALPLAPPQDPDPATLSAFRLVRQATWGPKPGDVDRVKQIGKAAFLAEQFAAPVSVYPDTLYTMSVEAVQEHFMRLALTGPDQLRQRVAWALHKIWVVSAVEIDNPRAIVTYKRVFLNGAFGNYRDLMRDMTLNPAMGRYLNMLNNKSQTITNALPNENYARELMQLFTLGLVRLNPDGSQMLDSQGRPIPSYTEDDVKELARVFTGWTFGDGNPATIPTNTAGENYTVPMEAVERFHDTGAKTILGTPFVPGRTTRVELDAALDLIFNNPNVGPFVSKQLIQMLVTSNPSPAYVAAVAAVFNNNGSGVRGDLRAVTSAILNHPDANLGTLTSGKLMEPALFVISQARSLNATVADHPFMSDLAQEMGQRVFYPGSVFSYFSPGYRIRGTTLGGPEYQILTSVTSLTRANYVASLIGGGFGADVTIDFTPFTSKAADPAALVDYCNLLFMGGQMSPAQRAEIISAVRVTAATNTTERARTALYLTLTAAQYQVDK